MSINAFYQSQVNDFGYICNSIILSLQIKPDPASEASKKQQVEQMFDNISHRYDFLNHLLSLGIDRGWRKKVRKYIGNYGHKYILDVATGTADLAIELCKLGDVSIIGVDISNGMLANGKVKLVKMGLDKKVILLQADSENLPYADNEFDAITVAFGVRNFEDLKKGMVEMRRVLKVGGHLAVLEFSKPKSAIVSALYWFYFKRVVPTIGKLFSKDARAYTYLPVSVSAFPEGAGFVKIAEECGYKNVRVQPLTFGISSIYLCEK